MKIVQRGKPRKTVFVNVCERIGDKQIKSKGFTVYDGAFNEVLNICVKAIEKQG